MDLNKVMIIGRLTRDPELKTTPGGASVCRLGLATNYVYNNQQTGQKVEQVEFHNIVLWRKLADIAGQYLKKGRRVYVEGRLTSREWQGQDGQTRRTTEIVADNMIMLDGTGTPGAAPRQNLNTAPVKYETAKMEEEQLPTIQVEDSPEVEDIPF